MSVIFGFSVKTALKSMIYLTLKTLPASVISLQGTACEVSDFVFKYIIEVMYRNIVHEIFYIGKVISKAEKLFQRTNRYM